MKRPFADYLSRSLSRIERDVPWAFALVGRHLGRRVVRLVVSGETVTIRASRGKIELAGEGPGDIDARTRRIDLIALADGEMTLEEAVMAGRLDLEATERDLLAGLDALDAYLNGAVRCPELEDVMQAFRQDLE